MKVLIAADKFKGSLSAKEACRAIEQGVHKFNPKATTTLLPMADGGEGSLAVLESTLNFKRVELTVTGPQFKTVKSYYGLLGKTAFIEMATASGLLLLEENERHAASTTTFGTGELILDALKKGARKIYLFIGGSATNDAGSGMAAALGYAFLNKKQERLPPIGASLSQIHSITGTPNPLLENTRFYVVSDVKIPLFGKNGAAMVYAAQKGANEQEIAQLDLGLQNFNRLAITAFSKDISQVPGAGAAGGLGAGAMLFLNAEVKPGVNTIMDLLGFDKLAQAADLIITGEGKVDEQTLAGKVVQGIINRCHKLQKPVSAVCGTLDLNRAQKKSLGATHILPIVNGKVTAAEAMENAFELLTLRALQLTAEFFV